MDPDRRTDSPVCCGCPGTLRWRESAELAAPLCVLYAFFCLTPWYMCRAPASAHDESNQADRAASGGGAARFRNLGETGEFHRAPGDARELAISGGGSASDCGGLLLYARLRRAALYVHRAAGFARMPKCWRVTRSCARLKAQINPHFLFNSLNSITALTTVDPAQAREMCIRLVGFSAQHTGPGRARKHFLARRAGACAHLSGCGAGALRRRVCRSRSTWTRLVRIAWCRRWCCSR